MARLFPLRTETPSQDGRPRVVDLEDEEADAVFGALASTTARQIYARLDDEPGTASDLAEAIDSSIQNVRYHLEKLENAGLVEVVDTWYSSRGNEMSVYAVTDGPLIVASDESRADRLREALSRFTGGVAVLGGASLLLQYASTRLSGFSAGTEGDSADGGAAAEDADSTDSSGGGGGEDDVGLTQESSGDDPRSQDDTADEGGSTTSDGANDGQRDGSTDGGGSADSADAGGSADSADGGGDVFDGVVDTATETFDAFTTLLSPGLAFFLGGLLVLTLAFVWWYWYRPSRAFAA